MPLFIENPLYYIGKYYLYILSVTPVLSVLLLLISKKGHATLEDYKHLIYNYLHLATFVLIAKFFSIYDTLAMFDKILQPLKLLDIGKGYLQFFACFLIVDLMFYFRHRLEHRLPLLWFFHSKHHSAEKFDSSLFARFSPFTAFYSWFFLLPPLALGFPADYIYVIYLMSSLLQFFVHLDSPTSFSFLGNFINSPRDHKIHHYQDLQQSNKNFGGILIIWDKLFRTYSNKVEPNPKYGIVKVNDSTS